MGTIPKAQTVPANPALTAAPPALGVPSMTVSPALILTPVCTSNSSEKPLAEQHVLKASSSTPTSTTFVGPALPSVLNASPQPTTAL